MSNIVYERNLPQKMDGYIVFIDGAKCKNGAEFLQAIWAELKFPGTCNNKWAAYSDWMRDLEWIEENDITIVIKRYDAFLSDVPEDKEYFVSSLKETIFPYWENDAIVVLESKDGIKNITVICTDGPDDTAEITPTEDIVDIFAAKALNGQKTPHSVSAPVIRTENGKLYLSVFVFFYNREQLQTSRIKRPSMWLLADLSTGEISARHSCLDKDFSASSHEKLYDISAKDVLPVSKTYWDSAYALMDLIRCEYLQNKKLRMDLYQEYLERILSVTPKEYQVFYRDLSNVGV